MHLTYFSFWIVYTWRRTCEFLFDPFLSCVYKVSDFNLNMQLSLRDDAVMKTAIGVLGDLADTLGTGAAPLIQNSVSSKDFLNECLLSDDRMIKESAEWAKMAISQVISF